MSGENYLNSVGMCYLQGIKKSEKYKYCFCRQWNVFLFRQTNKIFFNITGRGIDLEYCGVEWLALETNRDHSVVFEIASNTTFQTLLLTMMANPFLLRDSCSQ